MRCCIICLHVLLHPASITKPIFVPSCACRRGITEQILLLPLLLLLQKSVAPNQRHSTNKTRFTKQQPANNSSKCPAKPQTPTCDAFPDRSQIQLRIITLPPHVFGH
ncbi:hypothetical protein FVEG_15294 [Fusarium verticillioides 7600]|uniref:Secreted protein n=1 Tax=Gibberella moniliformis (strain M3125 / FGSC 7600) TaxID=334819 RepID=W7M971_GIBM7|nr:hypothetical protein FVEG_15294 [Fusarium verticillioides 7600]EWG41462.1 hypothetical protein FVEG_15294 [Fusarium verticillioides 7600]